MSSTFFSHVKRRRSPALVQKFVRDLESGLFEAPKSFDVLSRYRTEELKLDRRGQAMHAYFPESRLIAAFVAKYPQAKAQAIALQSFEPPIAKRFALQQLQVMRRERLPQAAAFAKVEQRMAPQLMQLTQQVMGTSVSQLQLVQQEEEQRLHHALAAAAEGKAPAAGADKAADPLDPAFQFGAAARRRKPKMEKGAK